MLNATPQMNPEIGDRDNKLTTFLTDHAEWSKKTFGNFQDRGPAGPLKHMAKEVPEAIEAYEELMGYSSTDEALEGYRFELADLFLLLVDTVHRSQWSFDGLVEYAKIKLERNKLRTWDIPQPDQPCEHRRGFTLIEVLTSITIVCILMALMLSAVHKVRESFRRTQCKDDIGQFVTAGATFKARYGVNPHWYRSHIPPQTKFRLCSCYVDRNGEFLKDSNGQVWPEIEILMNLYPSMNMTDNGLRLRGGVIPPDVPEVLDPTQFFFFLLTGGEYTEWQGFSYNKKQPFTPAVPGEKREVFLQINSTKKFWNLQNQEYDGYYRDPWGNPYIVHLNPYTYGPQRGNEPVKGLKRDSFQIVSTTMSNIEGN